MEKKREKNMEGMVGGGAKHKDMLQNQDLTTTKNNFDLFNEKKNYIH